jgi:hypothetical protein
MLLDAGGGGDDAAARHLDLVLLVDQLRRREGRRAHELEQTRALALEQVELGLLGLLLREHRAVFRLGEVALEGQRLGVQPDQRVALVDPIADFDRDAIDQPLDPGGYRALLPGDDAAQHRRRLRERLGADGVDLDPCRAILRARAVDRRQADDDQGRKHPAPASDCPSPQQIAQEQPRPSLRQWPLLQRGHSSGARLVARRVPAITPRSAARGQRIRLAARAAML